MKNPIAYFKHLVKDPINTVDEANARKKEVLPWFIGSAAFGVLTGALSAIEALNFLSMLTIIGVVGMMFFGFLLFVIHTAKKKFQALTCNSCNTMAEIKTGEDFGKYISCVIEKDEAIYKGYTGNKEPQNGVYTQVKISASSSAVVWINLTCPHCGEVKRLKYCATPFSCHIEKKNVPVLDYVDVRRAMEDTVKAIVDDYNDPEKRESIPYTFHSSKNPNFERRYEFKGANATDAHPDYLGARIDYHKDVDEMLVHYFLLNELSGTLSDPNPAPKKKAEKGAAPSPVENNADSNATETIEQTAPEQPCDTAEAETACAFASAEADTIYEAVPEQEITTEDESDIVAPVIIPEDMSSFEEPVIIPEEAPSFVEPTVIPEEAPAIDEPVILTGEEIPFEEPVIIESEDIVAEAESVQKASEAFAEPHEDKKKDKKRKGTQTLLIILLSICAVLLTASGIIIGILFAGQGKDKDKDEPKKEEETTQSAPETEKPELNVNDYVGYWYTDEGNKKELTIHNGLKDSTTFSLWYYDCEEYEIKSMTVQLIESTAEFSIAENGALIKGKLTFKKNAITLEITQSSIETMPVEKLNFTKLEATSQRYVEEADEMITEVYYVVDVLTEDHYVYESYSYTSAPVQYLPSGSYEVVAEYEDEDGILWGKLDSELGWICLTEISAANDQYAEETDDSLETEEPEVQLEAWQTAYLGYIDANYENYCSYALIHIDSDSIPELYVDYYDHAIMVSYKNSRLVETNFSIAGGSCAFIEYEGVFYVSSGRMGYYYDDIYTINSSGFESICSGTQVESETPTTDEYGNVYFECTYTLNGQVVSEDEYNYAFEARFDSYYASYANNYTMYYDSIVWEIENY